MLASVVSLSCGDDPDAWRQAGFTVDGGGCSLGGIHLTLGAPGAGGINGWTIFHPDRPPGPWELDGLPTRMIDELPASRAAPHPNGTTGLDHIVVSSPDIDRTTAALATIGVEARRTRDTTVGGAALRQRFFRMGTILELTGPPDPEQGGGPARFWGLALVTDDLDATASTLGDRLGPAADAVQPGRRIATLRGRELGISVPIAFMTPHRR